MTTSVKHPTRWATNTNYGSGPDIGTETKINPATADNGFINGVGAAAQHVNYVLQAQGSAARRALTLALCMPRKLDVTLDNTTGAMAAVCPAANLPIIVGNHHAAGTPLLADAGIVFEAGAVASLTGGVQGAAFDPSGERVLLVGSGGNRCCFSDDLGISWSAGGDLGASGLDLIWNPTYSRFVALTSGSIKYSSNGAAWTAVAVAGAGGFGIGLLPNGNMLTATGTTPTAFSLSTNGGTSWGAAGGTVPNAASAVTRGESCGAGLDYVYHLTRLNDGTLRVARTSDGATWTETATITPPVGYDLGNGEGEHAIRQCANTGALWVVALLESAVSFKTEAIYCSLDQGNTWSEPVLFGTSAGGFLHLGSVSAAGGRLIMAPSGAAAGGALYATDGVGLE
jgi:hypothetical protein